MDNNMTHSSMNKNNCSLSKFMWCKRNKTLLDVLLLQSDRRQGGNHDPASSCHDVTDYFPTTAQSQMLYSLRTESYTEQDVHRIMCTVVSRYGRVTRA